jgi:DNA-binding cell septation regulator SpoVG
MDQNEKPAARNGGPKNILITDWKPHQKNTLRGFFSATLASGLVLHDLMLHEKDGERWIGFPSREWTDSQGLKHYARIVEFSSRAAGDRFREAVLSALGEQVGTL